MSLRSKMLADASRKVDDLTTEAKLAVDRIAKREGIDPEDLAKLMYGKRVNSVRTNLQRKLADKAEAKLVEMYNNQSDAFEPKEEAKPAKKAAA